VDGQWILGAVVGLMIFVAGLRGTRWAIRRVSRTHAATVDGTWQRGVAQQSAEDGRRFEGNAYYFVSSAVMGACLAVAAVFSYVAVWIGLLGLFMAVLGAASTEALIRYGSASLPSLALTMRGWLRLRESSR
jgi:hypothetical protein